MDILKVDAEEKIKLLNSWFVANKLSLSLEKTGYCVFEATGVEKSKIHLKFAMWKFSRWIVLSILEFSLIVNYYLLLTYHLLFLCTQLTCLSVLYLYILYVCNQAISFDGVVPSGSLQLYF